MSSYSETTDLDPQVILGVPDHEIVFVALVHESPAVVWYDENEALSYYYGYITLQGFVMNEARAIYFKNITPAPDGLLELLGF